MKIQMFFFLVIQAILRVLETNTTLKELKMSNQVRNFELQFFCIQSFE